MVVGAQAQTKSDVKRVTVSDLPTIQPYAHYDLVIEDDAPDVAPMLVQGCTDWAPAGGWYSCGSAVCQDQSQRCDDCGPWLIGPDGNLEQVGCTNRRTVVIMML
jgi:hypothetical protein